MFIEIGSEYTYKYDLIRAIVLELIHKAMKLNPIQPVTPPDVNANTRIVFLFLESLEQQFAIESPLQRILFRSPSEFAGQLAMHVNHLSRSFKTASRNAPNTDC